MSKQFVYKIIFYNQNKVYEMYAKEIYQSQMLGFIEVEQLLFGKNNSTIVDPSEERLRQEFHEVYRTYVPLQSVIRIDEVEQEGVAKISEAGSGRGNVMPFPGGAYSSTDH